MKIILNCNCGKETGKEISAASDVRIGVVHKQMPSDYDGPFVDNEAKYVPLNYCPSCGTKTTQLEIYVDWMQEIHEVIRHCDDMVDLIPFRNIMKGDQITIMHRDEEEKFIAYEDAYELTACGEHKGYRVSGEKIICENEQLRMV